MQYRVGVQVTVDTTIIVDATSEEEAERKADEAMIYLDLTDAVFRHIEAIEDFGIANLSIDAVDPAV